jgi:hypothetical protein
LQRAGGPPSAPPSEPDQSGSATSPNPLGGSTPDGPRRATPSSPPPPPPLGTSQCRPRFEERILPRTAEMDAAEEQLRFSLVALLGVPDWSRRWHRCRRTCVTTSPWVRGRSGSAAIGPAPSSSAFETARWLTGSCTLLGHHPQTLPSSSVASPAKLGRSFCRCATKCSSLLRISRHTLG